ncbi:MAG: MFS transporter [Hyphomicrobium sp.]|nr:MFS transporter [Hyphomicrobium sp.]
MRDIRIKVAIALSYLIFAVLLNSVGTVILQSTEYFRVSKLAASTLEAAKDLPIALVSFLVAVWLPRFGLRRGIIAGLSVVGLACAAMPVADAFWATRLLFVAIGISFAVVKVSTYASVGLLTATPRDHASLLNVIEGVFMLGVLGGSWLFSAFIDAGDPASPRWLQVYWWLAGGCALAVVLLATARLDERAAHGETAPTSVSAALAAMWHLGREPLTMVFVPAVFLYVMIEQGIGTWLPTFNREFLGLSAPLSVQTASIFAGGLALGRLGAGALVRRTGWFALLVTCLIGMAALILVALPLARLGAGGAVTRWSDAPLAALVLPLIGVLMAPIYPAINSAVLSAIAPPRQSTMVGLIVVFSALGGTTGSLIIGRVFAVVGAAQAFYLLLVPIALLLATVVALRRAVADKSVPLA